MKKDIIRWWIILAAVLAVYNVVVFVIPFVKTSVFFLSWAFTLAAIGTQVYVVRTAFYKGKDARSKFYGFPIAKIGAVYLAIQMLLGLLFMAVGSFVPLWAPLVLYVALLGTAAVGLIIADTMRDEVERQDRKLEKDVACIRALQSKAFSMASLAQDSSAKKILEKFVEDLRFSDPVSSASLEDIEADLTACVDELQQAVSDNDEEAILALAQKAEATLVERNRLCKLSKMIQN